MVSRFVAGLCIAALALFSAPAASASSGAKPLTSAQCLDRVNDTVTKLVECVRTADLWQHMQKFQAIADANLSPADRRPSRNSGEPGYKASADYVAQVMTAAGYNVTIQTYTFTYYAFTGIPTWSESLPVAHDFVLSSEWNPGQSTGSTTNAALQPAGGIIIPPTSTPSSSSRTLLTTTSSRNQRVATRTMARSSTRTLTRSTERACSTTRRAPRRSWTSPR